MSAPQPKALAPHAHRASVWIAVLLDKRDGERIVLNELYETPEGAIEGAIEEVWLLPVDEQEHHTIHLVQVVLDRDTPAKWADDVMQRFEALDDRENELSNGERKVLDNCIDIVKDYNPTELSELGTAESLTLVDREGENDAIIR